MTLIIEPEILVDTGDGLQLHFSADLETMGKSVRAAIWEIALVPFNPFTNAVSKHVFHSYVSIKSCLAAGLLVDESTIAWWMEQRDTARLRFTASREESNTLSLELRELGFWMLELTTARDPAYGNADPIIWGNGIRSDNTWLQNAFEACNIPAPWPHWGNRDMPTLVNLCRDLYQRDPKQIPFMGTPHIATDDAIHQARIIQYGHAILKEGAK